MIGLILKDVLNLKKQARIYLILVIFYFILGIANKNSSMFSSMMAMVAVLIPITAMSYDERSKWDRYALTMPLSRATMVASKYLIGLIFLSAACLISIIVNMLFSITDISEYILISLASLSAGMILMALVFPLLFKFGVEKGRILLMIVLFAPTALISLLPSVGVSLPDEETIKSFIYAGPIIGGVIFLASFYISLSIYRKKEF